jgi:serine/threonine protein kinase
VITKCRGQRHLFPEPASTAGWSNWQPPAKKVLTVSRRPDFYCKPTLRRLRQTSFQFDDRDWPARFEREARLLAALNHPNIAHIHDIEEANGVCGLVMESIEGC